MAPRKTTAYLVIDADGKPAMRSLADLNREAEELDESLDDVNESGKLGGLSEGLEGVTDKLGLLAGPAGVGALGAAFVAIGNKAADVAIEAGTIATALDVSVTEASRLNAAFGDVGIESNDLVDIALQISGAIASDAETAKALGVAVGEAVEPIAAIKLGIDRWDFLTPTQRASAFGEEGVRQISRMVAEGKSLDEILEGVSDTRLVSDDDLAAALSYKNAMADVEGAVEGVVLALSDGVIPALTTSAQIAATIVETLSKDAPGGGPGLFDGIGEIFEKAGFHAKVLGDAIGVIDFGPPVEGSGILAAKIDAIGEAGSRVFGEIQTDLDATEQATLDNVTAIDRWKSALGIADAYDRLQTANDAYATASAEAWEAGITNADDFEEKVDAAESAERDLIDAVIAYDTEIGGLPEEVVTDIRADIDEGSVLSAAATIEELTKPRKFAIIPVVTQLPGGAIIDENGNVRPGTTNNTQNVTVNLGATASMRDVDAAVRSWAAVNG